MEDYFLQPTRNAYKKIIILICAALLPLTALVQLFQLYYPRKSVWYGLSGSIIYRDGSRIWLYDFEKKSGGCAFEYKGRWMGYSPEKGVIIGRSYPTKSTLEEETVVKVFNPHRKDASCDLSNIGKLDDWSYKWSYSNGKFYQIVGKKSCSYLNTVDLSKKTSVQLELPKLPQNIPVADDWKSAPSVFGSRIVFDVQSLEGYHHQQLILVDTNKHTAEHLGNGSSPVWSPDGRQIAFIPYGGEPFRINVAVFNCTTGKTDYIRLWHNQLPFLLVPVAPAYIMQLVWGERGDYIISQIQPVLSYHQHLFVTRLSTKETTRIPVSPTSRAWIYVEGIASRKDP